MNQLQRMRFRGACAGVFWAMAACAMAGDFGPGARTFLEALDLKTGDVCWERDEPGGLDATDQRMVGSWSTPIVIAVEGKEQILCSMPKRVIASGIKFSLPLLVGTNRHSLAANAVRERFRFADTTSGLRFALNRPPKQRNRAPYIRILKKGTHLRRGASSLPSNRSSPSRMVNGWGGQPGMNKSTGTSALAPL
jgi:hypothetical protein